ncbi:MAG: RNA-binding protein [Paracoccaceae bacterium]
MARGGREKDSDGPERRCIVSGQSQPRAGLIRFVVGPDASIVPDIAGKLPGRGIYVAADRAALEQAVKKRLFSRAAKMQVAVPDGLVETVHALVLKRVQETLSLARKAGQAVAGYEKVRDWLQQGEAAVLLQASDGSERGKTKLRAPEGEDTHVTCLTASELGFAFAREHVIHAALAAGSLSSRVVEEAAKLARLREQNGGDSAGED